MLEVLFTYIESDTYKRPKVNLHFNFTVHSTSVFLMENTKREQELNAIWNINRSVPHKKSEPRQSL